MKYIINKDPMGPLYITEEEMKLNYNCPADQKSGEGKGSCGGANGEKAETSKTSDGKSSKDSEFSVFSRDALSLERMGRESARGKIVTPKTAKEVLGKSPKEIDDYLTKAAIENWKKEGFVEGTKDGKNKYVKEYKVQLSKELGRMKVMGDFMEESEDVVKSLNLGETDPNISNRELYVKAEKKATELYNEALKKGSIDKSRDTKDLFIVAYSNTLRNAMRPKKTK